MWPQELPIILRANSSGHSQCYGAISSLGVLLCSTYFSQQPHGVVETNQRGAVTCRCQSQV